MVRNRGRIRPILPRLQVAGYRMRPGPVTTRAVLHTVTAEVMVGSVGEKEEATKKPCPSPSVILLWPASCLLTHTSFSTKALHSQPTLHTLTQNHSTTLHLLQFQVQECQRLRWCWVMLLWVSRRQLCLECPKASISMYPHFSWMFLLGVWFTGIHF